MFTIISQRLFTQSVAITSLIAIMGFLPAPIATAAEVADRSVETNKVIAIGQLSIGKITVSGNKEFTTDTILALLPSLRQGQALNIPQISREVVFANHNPALKIAVDVQPVSSSVADIVIRVTEQKAFHNIVAVDNTGDDQTGKTRISYVAIDYNWLGKAETAVFSYTRSPNNDKVNQFGFLNFIPLPQAGDTLIISGSYSNVDSGTVADYFNISGKGKAIGTHYNHRLKSTVNNNASVDFGLDYKEYNNVIDFSGTNLGTHIRTLPVSVAYQYEAIGTDSRFSGNIGFTRNMGSASSSQDVFDATRVGAVANYTIWRQNATYQKQLNQGWLFNVELESQYANTPLISGEEFGLGGSHSVRGFNERAVVGDKGVRLTTEFYTPEIAKGQRLVMFIDHGKYWLNNPQVGELPDQRIASYGIGWRLNTPGGTAIALDWAKVIKGTDSTPEGTTKLHIFASQSF